MSFGSGSRPTLTPTDGDQIEQQCPAISAVAPIVQARAQLVVGRNNWNTRSVVGTTATYLDVRDWQDLDEGDVFTDRDVLNANKVCIIGTTLRRKLFDNQSPIGKDMRISNVTFRVIGVLSSKGANMMGMDQDDIVVAPWTTIKYRVNAGLNNAGLSITANSSNSINTSVNSLSNLYPTPDGLYDVPSTNQTADTPQNISFVTVDNLYAKAVSGEQIPEGIREIKSLLRERHHIHTPSEDDDTHDDFNIRDLTELDQNDHLHVGLDGHPSADRGRHLADRGRRGHHEYHARLGHRANPRDRPPHGRRSAQSPHPAAVSRRGRGPLHGGRRHRRTLWLGHLRCRALHSALAHQRLARSGRHCRAGLGRRGHHLRFLPGLEGLAARSRSKRCGTNEQGGRGKMRDEG